MYFSLICIISQQQQDFVIFVYLTSTLNAAVYQTLLHYGTAEVVLDLASLPRPNPKALGGCRQEFVRVQRVDERAVPAARGFKVRIN